MTKMRHSDTSRLTEHSSQSRRKESHGLQETPLTDKDQNGYICDIRDAWLSCKGLIECFVLLIITFCVSLCNLFWICFGSDKENEHSSKVKNVQIYISSQTQATHAFESAITSWCKKFTCIFCRDVGQLSKEFPLVVVCQICSRFESDIDHVLYGVEWDSPYVVLLLHSGLESTLPRLSTASKLDTMEKYRNVEFIDVAFNTDAKLYECKMNKAAKNQLESFLAKANSRRG